MKHIKLFNENFFFKTDEEKIIKFLNKNFKYVGEDYGNRLVGYLIYKNNRHLSREEALDAILSETKLKINKNEVRDILKVWIKDKSRSW